MSRRTAQSSGVEIIYQPGADATPDGELNALAAVYKFLLDCSERKEAAQPDRPNDAKEIKHVRATPNNSR